MQFDLKLGLYLGKAFFDGLQVVQNFLPEELEVLNLLLGNDEVLFRLHLAINDRLVKTFSSRDNLVNH